MELLHSSHFQETPFCMYMLMGQLAVTREGAA